ncbi:MAG TPA: aquaporin [Gemmatimonadales bacterium]|jgi:aquaporin Z|nr:aquaporin [Gemmatimonadales bacterium]
MPSLLRRSIAEAIGTFALIFIGVGSVAAKYYPDANYGVYGIATAHGLVLAVMITATMAISGGHINPAVTVGLLVARRVTTQTAVAYIIAQLIGAVVGALAIKAIFPLGVTRPIALGTPAIASNIQLSQAIALEAILTFFLVSAVFATCVNPEAPKVGGFAVGLVLWAGIIVGGPLTGAALNPARAFGPALVAGQWVAHAVYWVGPLLGGIVAGLLWEHVLLPPRRSAA